MSYTSNKQAKSAKMLLATVAIFAVIFTILLLAGCSSAPVKTPDPAASAASTPTEAVKQDPPGLPVFGDVISFSDGLSVSASVPSEYTPTELAAGAVAGQSAVIFELVLTNNSDSPFDPILVLASASSAGTEASSIFDTSNNVGFPPTTTVLPGGTIKWNQAWSVADPNNIVLELNVGFDKNVIFVNPKN